MKGIILLLFCIVFVSGSKSSHPGDKCSNCLPKAHLKVYERSACKPIMSPECNCPLYYDCPPEVTTPPLSKAERRKLKKLGENACIFDEKVFEPWEDLGIPCLSCHCMSTKTARNVSGHVIKGSAFGECEVDECDVFFEEPKGGCYASYISKSCERCYTGQICAGHEKENFRCSVEGKTYRYGEKIVHLEKDLCKRCLCDEKFDENNLEQSTCWQNPCYSTSGYNKIDQMILMQHCTPIYKKKGCCPDDFICDKDFKPEAGSFKARPTNLTDTCVLRGKSYRIGQKRKFKPRNTKYFMYPEREKGGECTCRIPPLMTCYYDDENF